MEVKDFFEELYAPVKESHQDYKMLTVEIKHGDKFPKNGTRVSPFDYPAIKKAMDAAVDRGNSHYFHLGMGLGPDAHKRGVKLKKEDMVGSCFLWAEIDDKDGELSEERWTEIKNDCYGPDIIVRSGNGYHLYFLLDGYYADSDGVERRNRWLANYFSADSCFDINRILRVPGTYNFKDADDPKPVHVIYKRVGSRRSLDFFPQAEEAAASKAKDWEAMALGDAFLQDSRFGPARWVIDKMFEKLDGPTEANGFVGQRSKRDYQVAQKMADLGFTEQEIYSTLVHSSWPVGDKGRENVRYAQTTAAKVSSRTDNFDSAVATMLEKAFSPHEEQQLKETLVGINSQALANKLRTIYHKVLQPGGIMRPDRDYPKFGAVFGEEVAVAIHDAGYRYVFDPEYDLSFISDRRGRVWEAVQGGTSFEEFISGVSGYGTNQEEFKFISSGLIRYIKRHGEQIKVGRWVHYDHDTARYFILADSKTGKMYVINRDGSLDTGFNGAGDVFLRPRIQSSVPMKLSEGVSAGDAVRKLDSLFSSFIAGPKSTQRFTTAFLLAITMCYGSDRIGTLPILHLTGPSGGGKSATIGCMTSYLFGYVQVLLYKIAAAYRTAPTEVFMAHDDKENLNQEMEEFFLLCSTRVVRTMCDTGNQKDVVTQRAHVINGITSIDQLKTTALRRRTFVIEIDKSKFPSKEVLTEDDALDLAQNRDFLWSGMVPIFAKMIGNFQEGTHRALAKRIYGLIVIDEFKALSSFLALMVLVEKELCEAAGRAFDEDETIQSFIRAASMEDNDEILGRDPLVLCLSAFFEQFFAHRATETYDLSDVGDTEVKMVSINRTLRKFQWELTTDEENDTIGEKLGCKVRGIKASATGWVSIFSSDTSEYARTINSPTSLGKQFSRVEQRESDFPFYVLQTRAGKSGKVWSVFQKIE